MCAERLPGEQKEFFHRPRLGRSTWRPDPAGPMTLASNRAQRAAPDFFVLPPWGGLSTGNPRLPVAAPPRIGSRQNKRGLGRRAEIGIASPVALASYRVRARCAMLDEIPDNDWDTEVRQRSLAGEDAETVRAEVIKRYLDVCGSGGHRACEACGKPMMAMRPQALLAGQEEAAHDL
jgi:hypothetical protein